MQTSIQTAPEHERGVGATGPTATVTTIVVTYNNARQIEECLASVLADPAAGGGGGLIVFDNASSDATVSVIAERFPQVTLICSPDNLGFGRACNLAAEQAHSDFLAFVNPDAVLLGDAITRLVTFARTRPRGGIYGGRTVEPDGTPGLESVFAQPSLWGSFCFGSGLSTLAPRTIFDPESMGRWERDTVREVGFVAGLLMLVDRALWTRLGGFDHDYFMYCEDADLALRAARLGYRPCMTPDASVTHEGGGSSPTSGAGRTLLLTGRVTFMRKNWSPLRSRAGIGLLALGVAIRAAGGESGWRDAWGTRSRWLRGYARAAGARAEGARVDDPLGGMRSRGRTALTRAIRTPLYHGDRITCPCCGGHFRKLITHRGVPDVRCPRCGSMERHRLLWLYLQQRTDLVTRHHRVLHMAPETAIQRLLRKLPNIDYVSADLASPLADVHCDLQSLPFEDGSFDVVICNHVLEHIPDDRRAMTELARVTAPGGFALLMCPIAADRATTLEDPSVKTSEDALRVYSQEDHVRLYGADYCDRLEAAGFTMRVERFLEDLDEEVVERYKLRSVHDVFEEDHIYIGRMSGSA